MHRWYPFYHHDGFCAFFYIFNSEKQTHGVKSCSFIILLITFTLPIHAQRDTLIMSNGDMLIGEIKELKQGVMKFETDYSDKDFAIEWNKVRRIYTSTRFIISLSDGDRINGTFKTDPTDSSRVLIFERGGMKSAKRMDIVYLKGIEETFFGRFDASIGLGITITKENNLKQLNTRGSLGYTGRFWRSDGSFDALRSIQQDTISIRRTEGSLGGMLLMESSWFMAVSSKLLQSDEQKLKLRSTTDVSGGNLIVNTNRLYLAAAAGLAWTHEEFTDETPLKNSMEGKVGFELNLFDLEDFSLLTNAYAYPGITQRGRVRIEFKIDLKYDLPLDFYIKFGYTHNYDNQPAAETAPHFYKLDTTIGWEL